jgi:hypothetical protein
MQDKLLSIILLFTAINILALAVFNKPIKYDFIVIVAAIILIVFALNRIYNVNALEQFDEQVSLIDEDENITPFSTGLTIYNSCFSKKSFPTNTRTWLNISPYFANGSCPDIRISDTHMNFIYNPAFSQANGFYMGNNVLNGPMCHQIGITANDSFSVFFSFKFASFVKDPQDELNIIQLFANTLNNNGLKLFIEKNYSIENDQVKANMVLQYANTSYRVSIPPLNTSYNYMIAIVKDSLKLIMYFYPNISDLSSTSSQKIIAVNTEIDMNIDVLLSNKEMVVNKNKNIAMNIYNIGFYNKALQEYHINDIYNHTQKHLQKSNQLLKNFATQISELNQQILKMKSCPYDAATCKLCNGVTNWSNVSNVLNNATTECLAAVDTFCKQHPTHEKCVCWDPANSQSKGDACKAYVSIFSKETDIEALKSKHNLCPCDKVCPKPQVNVTTTNPLPRIINKAFEGNANKTDIELYYALPIV